ncbi:MAG: DedA family protein [Campylobacteraceae bacterium]|jgi:membrane protein DedA with SNARE-associated domain|nr:DedA family protein [Campylobacteraceae bacterium]
MEEFFNFGELIVTYGYIILFIWCILEGEMALIMGGILSHSGDMNIGWAIFIAGLGGFAGDQIYFYLGRYFKKNINKRLKKQRRKFAIAHLLLKRYGWPVIFIQRYMYGLRTVIPMSIGITRYSGKKFALINIISAWCWASVTIIPAYLLGEHIWGVLKFAQKHWYFAIPVVIIFACLIIYAFKKIEDALYEKKLKEKNANQNNR